MTTTWIRRRLGLFSVALLTASALAAGLPARASTITDFTRGYAGVDALTRATGAYQICDQTLSLWPGSAYAAQVQEMGREWGARPDAAYYLISTCQTLWISRYLDPLKAAQIHRAEAGSDIAFKLSALDLLGAARALKEEIRLYNQIGGGEQGDSTTPPAPYELLSGLASNERDLNETLNKQVAAAVTALTAAGGTAVQVLQATREFSLVTARAGAVVSRTGVEAALLVTVLAWGAGEVADYGMWWFRRRDLWNQVYAASSALMRKDPARPLPVLLDEFYRATERLGYFYSYNLYLSESGATSTPDVNKKCYSMLSDFFSGAEKSQSDFGAALVDGSICPDAATIWLGAGQFLGRLAPDDARVRQVAERLIARAKRTFWSYAEIEAYRATQPVCTPVPRGTIFHFDVECRDPKTGGLVL